jgi:hypothetical protein
MRYRVEVTFPVVAVGYFDAETPEEAAKVAKDRAPFAVDFPEEGAGGEWESIDILEVSDFEIEESYPE